MKIIDRLKSVTDFFLAFLYFFSIFLNSIKLIIISYPSFDPDDIAPSTNCLENRE